MFMVSRSFWVEFFGSLRYQIMSSVNRDILTVSLPICIPFISSSCLIALLFAKNSKNLVLVYVIAFILNELLYPSTWPHHVHHFL
jgi:hypothetical protein